MKITFIVLFLLCSAAAFGQVGASIPNQPQIIELPSHPQHADIHALANEESLVGGGGVSYAQGERPLWEFGPVSDPPPPLGDVARAYRKEKLAAKKAGLVLEKQGS